MSSVLDHRRVDPSTGSPVGAAPAKARLTVVPHRRRRASRIPFAALVVLTLGLGVVGLLLLNTSLQQGAFHTATLGAQAANLLDRQQDLELRVDALRSPQRLAERARRLGMVPYLNPVFLRLSDGRVIGRPRPAPPGGAPGSSSVERLITSGR